MIIKRNPKPFKVKRNPPNFYKMPAKNLGGFLPDPPDDCEKKKYWKFIFNHWWIDLSSCHTCSIIKECHDRSTYLAALKKQRDDYFTNLEINHKTNLKRRKS